MSDSIDPALVSHGRRLSSATVMPAGRLPMSAAHHDNEAAEREAHRCRSKEYGFFGHLGGIKRVTEDAVRVYTSNFVGTSESLLACILGPE
jgi:hypothetical protein